MIYLIKDRKKYPSQDFAPLIISNNYNEQYKDYSASSIVYAHPFFDCQLQSIANIIAILQSINFNHILFAEILIKICDFLLNKNGFVFNIRTENLDKTQVMISKLTTLLSEKFNVSVNFITNSYISTNGSRMTMCILQLKNLLGAVISSTDSPYNRSGVVWKENENQIKTITL